MEITLNLSDQQWKKLTLIQKNSQADIVSLVDKIIDQEYETLQTENLDTPNPKEAPPTIIQTERGLSISGTRITLYDVMDYVTAGWPPHLIRAWLPLSESQLNVALDYIEKHRAEVETEYQKILKEAEELRQYYEEKNRDLITQITNQPPQPGTEAIWEKLQASKKKLGLIE